MAPDNTAAAVRPVQGIQQFRERCRLTVEHGELVARDYQGREHRFPLDGSNQAPFEYRFYPDAWTIVDRQEEGLVRGELHQWDVAEILDLTGPAGIAYAYYGSGETPPLRDDGVALEEPYVAKRAVPLVAGASGLALPMAYLMPIWIAAVYFAVVMGVALYSWRAGALAPARRSKSTPEWEARAAKAEKERLAKEGPRWEPPLQGRWRLAVELHFGIFFVGAVVALVRGEFAPAAVLPIISVLFFFYTRYVFPGIWWNWWAWVIIGNVGAVVLFLTVLTME